MVGGIVLGSIAVSAVSADVLPYISVAIKVNFLKFALSNIYAKKILLKVYRFFLNLKFCSFDRFF